MDDGGTLIVEERSILEKFDGEAADGRLVERITIVDGEIVAHEYFDPDDQEDPCR